MQPRLVPDDAVARVRSLKEKISGRQPRNARRSLYNKLILPKEDELALLYQNEKPLPGILRKTGVTRHMM